MFARVRSRRACQAGAGAAPASRCEPVVERGRQVGQISLLVGEPGGALSRHNPRWHVSVPGSSLFRKASTSNPPMRGSIPRNPRRRRLVTHGHADHARGGHGAVWATPETLAIMGVRYGEQQERPVAYGETDPRRRGRRQLRPGRPRSWKRPDRARLQGRAGGGQRRLQAAARPDLRAVRRHPVRHFHHRGDVRTAGISPSRHRAAKSTGCFTASMPSRNAACWLAPMRWARRSGSSPNCAGADTATRSIITARSNDCAIFTRNWACRWATCDQPTGVAKDELRGKIVIAPPSALNDRWSRRLPDPMTAMASGWMRIRQRARQRNVELPLIISDHSDWDELTHDYQGSRTARKCGSPTVARTP